MQRFRFRLATVLNWRNLQLEMEQGKLETLFAERKRKDQELEDLANEQRAAESILSSDTIEGQALAALDAHRHGVRRAVERIHAAAKECDERIAAQRAQVLEAERRVQLLARLKERRLAEWQLAADKELDTLASETFLAKWVRERKPA